MEEKRGNNRRGTYILFISIFVFCVIGILGYFLYEGDDVDLLMSSKIIFGSRTYLSEKFRVEQQVKGEQIKKDVEEGIIVEESILYSARILTPQKIYTVEPGQEIALQITAENRGTVAWHQDDISINVVGGEVANMKFKHPSWLTDLRTTHLDQIEINPGEIGTFSFVITAPSQMGIYTFQTMIVRQHGFLFENIGENIFTATLSVEAVSQVEEKKDIKDPNNLNTPKSDPQSYEVNDTNDSPQNTSYHGGGSGSQDIDVDKEDVEVVIPDISIALSTSTTYTTSTSIVITGSYSTGTAHIFVNGTSTLDLIFDEQTKQWSYKIRLDIGTSTFTFVGMDIELEKYSQEYTVTVVRTEEIIQQFPEITIENSSSTALPITSSTYLITGTYNSSTGFIWVNGTSSEDLIINTSSYTWQYIADLNLGSNVFVFSAWDANILHEATSSIEIVYTPETPETPDPDPAPEANPPIINVPTASSTYSTSSSTVVIGGNKDASVETIIVFNSTTQHYIELVTTVSSTWEAIVDLVEIGTYDIEVYGITHNVTSSPTYIQLIRVDEEPILNSFTISTDNDSILFHIDSQYIGYHFIEFFIAPDDEYTDLVCGENATWYETQDLTILSSLYTFMDLFDQYSCVKFITSTTLNILDVPIDPDFKYLVVEARAKPIQESSTESWMYASTTWGLDPEQPEVFPEGNVVISEIAWMGTKASHQDEWFEICNADNVYIDLTGWRVLFGGTTITIGDRVLAPLECFVFERTDQTTISNHEDSMVYSGDMKNSGEYIQLYSSLENLMDEVDASTNWFAGDNGTKDTMVRVDPSISGNESANWCSFSSCPDPSLKGVQNGLDEKGNMILGSVGNMSIIKPSI